MSGKQRGIATIVVVILLLIAPSVIALSWYKVTGNPLFRPLGITRESMGAYFGNGEWIEIVAEVAWDDSRSGRVTREDMERALRHAFKAKGIEEMRVVFRNSSKGTWVLYRIGPSAIGPYPQSRAAEGISAAVNAYRMNIPFKP